LAQENMVLQKLKAETKEQYTDGLCQETIDVKRINWEVPLNSTPTESLLTNYCK